MTNLSYKSTSEMSTIYNEVVKSTSVTSTLYDVLKVVPVLYKINSLPIEKQRWFIDVKVNTLTPSLSGVYIVLCGTVGDEDGNIDRHVEGVCKQIKAKTILRLDNKVIFTVQEADRGHFYVDMKDIYSFKESYMWRSSAVLMLKCITCLEGDGDSIFDGVYGMDGLGESIRELNQKVPSEKVLFGPSTML